MAEILHSSTVHTHRPTIKEQHGIVDKSLHYKQDSFATWTQVHDNREHQSLSMPKKSNISYYEKNDNDYIHIVPRLYKTRTVWSCCQTDRGRSSKPDPSDLLRSPRQCPTISWLETRLWSTSHHLDPSDLPGHENISDRRPAAGKRSLVLATNRNSEMLQLNASRHDDDGTVC